MRSNPGLLLVLVRRKENTVARFPFAAWVEDDEVPLRRAKRAGKQPGCHYGGITLPSGRKAFAIYRDGKVVEKYTA